MNNTLLLLPARTRQIIYVVHGLTALAILCAVAGLHSVDAESPGWLIAAGAVVGTLLPFVNSLAALNVTDSTDTKARPQGQVMHG